MRKLNELFVVIMTAFVCTASVQGEIPSGGPIKLTMPTRMVKGKTLTLKAEILDQYGCKAGVEWRKWSLLGTVSAKRVSDGSSVPTSITVFETYNKGAGGGVPPPDSIRFYNGIGSVSIYFDNPATIADNEQIEIIVEAAGKKASKVVTVLPNSPGTFRTLSGTLLGAGLTWSASDGVIHLTGDVMVPAGFILTILPGTLIMADKGTAQAGVAINVNGQVIAQGTAAEPIFFFPTEGSPALALVAGNYNSWRGIYHDGQNTSVYSYVFFTGGGNGVVGSYHLYPPMLRFASSHSLTMSDCVLADCPATMILGDYGGGNFNVYRTLLARGGIGAKFGAQEAPARAHMAVTFEDTWFCRIGRGVEDLQLDGDALHWDSDSSQGLTFRRCVITDIGDDAVDGSDEFYIKTYFYDCIAYDLDDKLTTYWPGDAYANNLLLFACNKGLESVNGYPTQCTLGDQHPFPQEYGGDWWVNQTVAWPGGTDPGYDCGRFHASYTLLDTSQHVGCGTGNLTADPLFVDPMTGGFPPTPGDYKSSYDYSLQPDSPALTAGPGGTRIGWLGFPRAEPCSSSAQCGPGGTYDDGNPCTTDTCELGVCVHTMVDDCIACCQNSDCDYGDPCVVGTCQSSGVCAFAPAVDGTTCDDGLFCTNADHCAAGVCIGGGATCDDGRDCTTDTCDEVNDVCTHAPLPAGTACGDPTDNVCTDPDACDSAGTCLPHNVANGTTCDDGLYCNGAETCQSGVCESGGDPCAPLACNEATDTCGLCTSDGDCSDGIFCNGQEHCNAQGHCESGANPCPGQMCDEAGDHCVQCLTDSNCDDGLYCNGPETCVNGVCQPGSNPCSGGQTCDEVGDRCVQCLIQADCDDGLYCNGQETCGLDGQCHAGTPPCDDGIACTDDACSEATQACTHAPNNGYCVDDGQFCDGGEYCDAVLGCRHSGNPCATNELCNETLDTCVPAGECLLGEVGPLAGPSPNQFRWKDIADNVYQSSYQGGYNYGSPSVVAHLTYQTISNAFQGVLEATNLKPNFSYQMKIVANPTAKYVSALTPAEYRTLHAVASIGRWWDATTGQINPPYNPAHQMQSYLLFDHFETDNFGNATKAFYADSSFHVLFTGSGGYKPVTSLVNPGGPPPNAVAYSTPYPAAEQVTVYAQNEQGTPGATFLPSGHYEGVVFLLTEESFHQNGTEGGYWASAMACEILFDIRCNVDANCNDGVDCTVDRCVNNVCVFTPDDGACPEDGLFCNGEEICDPREGCVHAGDPCGLLTCDEQADRCVQCLTSATCDDGLFCNGLEQCVEGTCQAGSNPCPDQTCDEGGDTCVSGCITDAECDDGAYCNGAEWCDAGTCVGGTAPCGSVCEQCSEESEICEWCQMDLDGNGFIGPGEFGFFAGCFGRSYAVGEPCRLCNFDGSADGFVGPGDFGGFAGCFGGGCTSCANCWPVRGGKRSSAGASAVEVVLVPVGAPTARDVASSLPARQGRFTVGSPAWVEMWARVGPEGAVLAGVYAEVSVQSEVIGIRAIEPSEALGLFALAEVVRPWVQDLSDQRPPLAEPPQEWPDGGFRPSAGPSAGASGRLSAMPGQLCVGQAIALSPVVEMGGCAPLGEEALGAGGAWVRVGVLQIGSRRPGPAHLSAQPAGGGYGVALRGELGLLAECEVQYGECDLRFVLPTPVETSESLGRR